MPIQMHRQQVRLRHNIVIQKNYDRSLRQLNASISRSRLPAIFLLMPTQITQALRLLPLREHGGRTDRAGGLNQIHARRLVGQGHQLPNRYHLYRLTRLSE